MAKKYVRNEVRRNVYCDDCEHCPVKEAYLNVFDKPTYDTDDAMIIFFVRHYCCEKITARYIQKVAHCPRYLHYLNGGK